jgi:hypothetical protein
MELILDKQKTGGRRKSRLQERFDKLRSKLERERRRNVRFRQDLEELVEIYHRRSIDNDRVLFDDLVALSEKLIVFAGRKSLSDWHREELDEWLRNLIEWRISQVDRQVAERLRLDYRQAIAGSMGISVDELVARFEAESEGAEQEFGEIGRAERSDDMDEGPWQEDLFGFEDVDPETEAFNSGAEANGPDWLEDEDEAHIGRTPVQQAHPTHGRIERRLWRPRAIRPCQSRRRENSRYRPAGEGRRRSSSHRQGGCR